MASKIRVGSATKFISELAPVMYNIFRYPGSTAEIEINHKINNHVTIQLCCVLSESKVENKTLNNSQSGYHNP